ncbi:MAG: DUF2935 domain-containing protein [Paenibacillaceae bacterium]|nr:DUF2935 domain-containing protein [Paenibacillaceae bacterium]
MVQKRCEERGDLLRSEEQFEHLFWLQILGDHARFILLSLSPKETKDIETAEQFITFYDRLLDQARGQAPSWEAINRAALEGTHHLRIFKLNLLERLLLGQVQIALTPTFINHMVNELDEYLKILEELNRGNPVPQFHPLHYDLIWLADAAGHAFAIAAGLDGTEKPTIEASRRFEKTFQDFYAKAIELTGYLRTMKQQYPAIFKFHKDVNVEMAVFMKFLKEIEALGLSHELLSRINPLMPDHMYREECYYLTKLARSSGDIPAPDCNPAAPRLQQQL